MENLPHAISILFVLTTALTLFFFYRATHNSKKPFVVILIWLAAVMAVALTGFFAVTQTLPPRFVFLVAPPVLVIIGLFSTAKGREFLDGLDVSMLTLLHVVRIPVELVLFFLFQYGVVPELMTFEGRNFDILSGLSAPLVYYFGFKKKSLGPKFILIWNIACLLLLFNIVSHAVLSAPTPFQQLAFDQPNIAVLYFPFVWLPSCIVPLVLFSHLSSLRKLLSNENQDKIISQLTANK